MQVVVLNNSDKPTLIASWPEFIALKKWIEGTSLYDAILKDSGTNTHIVGVDGSLALTVSGRKINSVEELPIELVIEFYNNWPDRKSYEATNKDNSVGKTLYLDPKVTAPLLEPSSTIKLGPKAFNLLTEAIKDWENSREDLISDQRREDMLVGALEGGSNYWYWIPDESTSIIESYSVGTEPRLPLSESMWIAIKRGETIHIHDNENRKTKIGQINLESIRKGEILMLEKQPTHFENIIEENDDAETADVWFQFCVLGDIVYG